MRTLYWVLTLVRVRPGHEPTSEGTQRLPTPFPDTILERHLGRFLGVLPGGRDVARSFAPDWARLPAAQRRGHPQGWHCPLSDRSLKRAASSAALSLHR